MLKGYTVIEDAEKWLPPASIQSCARLIMLRYTRCCIVILMAATAWLMLSFSSSIVFLWGHLKTAVYESNLHTIQELKGNISHAVAAIKITMLHRVYLNTIRRAQLCIDAGVNHFQRLL